MDEAKFFLDLFKTYTKLKKAEATGSQDKSRQMFIDHMRANAKQGTAIVKLTKEIAWLTKVLVILTIVLAVVGLIQVLFLFGFLKPII